MSKAIIGYLIVVGLIAASAGAQTLDRMARRVDSLQQVAIAARERVEAYRKAHPPTSVWTDSAVVAGGAVKVYFNGDVAGVARAGAMEAEKELEEFGTALQSVRPFVFSVVPDTARNSFDISYRRTKALSVRHHQPSDPLNPNRSSVDHTPRAISESIVLVVAGAMAWRTGPGLAAWKSGGLPLVRDGNPKPDWSALRLAIVSSPSPLGRSCFLGEIQACRIFLGLDSVPDPPRMLFDSAGRRRVVEYEGDRSMRASRVATQRCLGGNDDACLTVLELTGVSPLSSPFVKNSLVTHALDLGGERAVERLLLSPGSAADALSAAARRPIDSLVADWQSRLGDRSGSRRNLPVSIAVSSLVWIALFSLLSLRSSRWR